jgi:hypothetical protein
MAQIFGFNVTRLKEPKKSDTFIVPDSQDGAYDIASGGFFGNIMDLDGRDKNNIETIENYREIAKHPECDLAIEDIVNEAIVASELNQPVSLNLDGADLGKAVKDKIREEFDAVVSLLDFSNKGHEIFRQWYVDGRIYYHKVIDNKAPKKGINELRFVDCKKVRKVRDIQKEKNRDGVEIVKNITEYYIYNDKGFDLSATNSQGLKITKDSIAYVPSGLIDQSKGVVQSYLHKALKPVNQLTIMEDSLVIYRMTRAPERRIFYIDVGNLPKSKAEQYLNDVMNKYRNKVVYNASTGSVSNDRNQMSMMEDFWLPRREGGRGTEIDTLAGGENLGQIDDVEYFRRKLYRALNVPVSRLESDAGFTLGRDSEITRDELKFSKFIQRLRKKFAFLFLDILKTQLILKNITTTEDWEAFKEYVQIDYLQDSFFTELKDGEILTTRLDMLGSIQEHIGTYFSKAWVQKNVLHLTDEDIVEMKEQIAKEKSDGEIEDEEEDY